MPEEDNKILKYKHGGKSMKFPFAIYADFCLDLREYETKVINYEKKRNDTLNKKRRENA